MLLNVRCVCSHKKLGKPQLNDYDVYVIEGGCKLRIHIMYESERFDMVTTKSKDWSMSQGQATWKDREGQVISHKLRC